jgi:short-subunit dehydrogenase
MKEFKDKVAVITGASSGIGKQLAFDLASLGCKVVLIARNKENLLKAKKEIGQIKTEVMAISCDVTDKKQVKEMAEQVLKKFGRIDLLINDAGYGNYRKIDDAAIEDFESMMATNYLGTVYCIKSFLPVMRRQGEGHIVNIASMVALIGFPGFSAYGASKWAVLGFSESLYNELYGSSINLTVVCPSGVDTNFFSNPTFDSYKRLGVKMLKPVEVSRATINAIKGDKFFVVVPSHRKIIRLIKAIAPGLVNSVLRKMAGKAD